MTTEQRILRFAEYWCYHKPRESEMADELRVEINRISKECFAAGMNFQQDSGNPDFDEVWPQILVTEIKY
jgi:hypothetical protein